MSGELPTLRVRHVSGGDVAIRSYCRFPVEDRLANIRSNIASPNLRDLADLAGYLTDRRVAIVGAGSTADLVPLEEPAGSYFLACERIAPWLDSVHRLDGVVALDASPDVARTLLDLPTTIDFFLGLQCAPEAAAALAGRRAFSFLTPQDDIPMESLQTDREVTGLLTGPTVVMAAVVVATYLGSRNIHIYGFDGHLGEGDYHKQVAGESVHVHEIGITVASRPFRTTAQHLWFATEMLALERLLLDAGEVDEFEVHGDTLFGAMRPFVRAQERERAAA